MVNFYNELLEVLRKNENYFSEDGTLLKNRVYEAAIMMDSILIELLLTN